MGDNVKTCAYYECELSIAEGQNYASPETWRLCEKHQTEFNAIVDDVEHYAPRMIAWWIKGQGGPKHAANRV